MSGADQKRTPDQQGDQPSLSQVGKLLLYDELLMRWAVNDPSRLPLLKKVYGCVGRLESETGWELEVLLQRLGCDTAKADFDEKLTPRRLAICTEYMEWVEELVADFDRQLDKRLVIKGASRFYKAADEDLRLAKRIMTTSDEPALLLSLGEIGQAWRAAARCLPGSAGERARRLREDNPFVDANIPHISPQRLEMLSDPRSSELLGARVEARMKDHLAECSRCTQARERLSDLHSASGTVGVLR